MRTAFVIFIGISGQNISLGDLFIDGRITLKRALKKQNVRL